MVACRMNEVSEHLPVLLDEVIQGLSIKPDGIYVDATFGRGGHAQAILNQLSPDGQLIAFDQDPYAVAYAKQRFAHDNRFTIFHAAFTDLEIKLAEMNVATRVDGILFDLGVSSPQLDEANRGFSFMREGDLDMRMNIEEGIDAKTWIANISEKELADILFQYGEEKFSRRIARAIIIKREQAPITTTTQLAEIVSAAIPRWEKGKHPATRSFLAIRIAVNNELEQIKSALTQSLEVLAIGGRLAVISFHSLEDRIVKRFIQLHEKGGDLPVGLPIKQAHVSRLRRVGRAIKPSSQEVAFNPRARSSILRIAEKLT